MQQKIRVPLLTVVQLFLWLAPLIIAAQTACDPPCVAGQEQCQQVFNTNEQYTCVAIVSPSTQATSPTTAAWSSSPVPAGCRSCLDSQTCEQVFNSDQYQCVDSSTKVATSPTSPALTSPAAASTDIPAGCEGCSQAQICEQVFNSNQYHCVNNSTKTATSPTPLASPTKTPVPAGCQACTPTQLCQQVYNSNQYQCVDNSTAVAAPAPSNRSSDSVNTSACQPACADDEVCEQVFNSKQYACQPKKGATPSTAVSIPVTAVAPVAPGVAEPALSSQAAGPPTSKGGLSGGAIFAIILSALILLTAMALASFIIHSKWKSSYVRYESEPEPPKFATDAI